MCPDVCRKVFGFPLSDAPKLVNDFVKLGRTEAAAKLCKNREVVRAGKAPLLPQSVCPSVAPLLPLSICPSAAPVCLPLCCPSLSALQCSAQTSMDSSCRHEIPMTITAAERMGYSGVL